MNDVHIDDNNNIFINPTSTLKPLPEFSICKECGTELFGGEATGPDANGYCDTCN